jgi:hypothetical protein
MVIKIVKHKSNFAYIYGSRIRKVPRCLNWAGDIPRNFNSLCGNENLEPRENFCSFLTNFLPISPLPKAYHYY